MSFPRYPAYKDSGVPWLGNIPSHWEMHRLKSLFDLMKREPREEDGIVTAFRDGEVTLRSNRRVDGFTNAVQEIGYQGIRHGDLVIHAMDAFAGAIGVSDSDGKSTPVYSVCTPKGPWIDSWYYGLTLRHMALSGFVNSLAKGIRERSTEFRWADASVVTLPLPPISEQVAIKDFIAHETAKIDALVAEQERLIELLKEKRQAVISHAVTKGLDPSVPMKDSGVDWLGEVPAHWEVDRLKVSLVSSRNGIWGGEAAGDENDIPCVRVADFERQKLRVQEAIPTIRAVTLKERQGRLLSRGNLLLEKSGGGETQPVGCVVLYDCDTPAVCSNFVARVELRPGMFPAYWCYVHAAAYAVRLTIGSINQTSGIQNLDQDRYFNERAPFPPYAEQVSIATFLDRVAGEIDALANEAQFAIRLLQERRTALISAAVTGQIDVRGWVPAEAVIAAAC